MPGRMGAIRSGIDEMAAALVAAVIAVVLGHTVPALSTVRRFDWFIRWRAWVQRQLQEELQTSLSAVLLVLLPPVLLLAALQSVLESTLFGLPGFVLALLVLVWCWGPRDLDRDVEELANSSPRAATDVAQRLSTRCPVATDGGSLVEAVFRAALQRWFAVLLWFLLLGAAGALLYRLTQLAADSASRRAGDTPLGTLRIVLEWPAAQLMVLALALAASFDAVVAAWREWHLARGRWLVADVGFLYAAARASVALELAEEDEEELTPPDVAGRLPAARALRDAMSLVWRMLIVWLTVLAVFVLAGFVG
jgi:AmpE protein